MPIDLSKGRVLAFTVGKRSFTLTLKPIETKAWLKYFAGITSTEELVDGKVERTYDSSGARLELLEAHLIDATGYTKEGDDIKAIPGWQGKIPMPHRRAAADLLTDCEAIAPADDAELPPLGLEVITLAATWTAVDGVMQRITGLQHIFQSPTADHQKRYSRAMSRSVVTGGSRTGKTNWLGAQDVLIAIYDELIVETKGYDYGLGDGWDKSKMDAYHKVAATQALFTPVSVEL